MNLLKRHWLIASLIVVAVAVFAAFRFKGSDQPKYLTAGGPRKHQPGCRSYRHHQCRHHRTGRIAGLRHHLEDGRPTLTPMLRKGQLIAQIEPSLFEGAVLQAKADLENAKANLAAGRANLEKAKAASAQTKADFERTDSLVKRRGHEQAAI